MAARDSASSSVVMCFSFEHSDAIVELIDDAQLLIRGSVIGQDEGAVVCSNIGNVAVLSTAEFGIIVACLRTNRNQRWVFWVKVKERTPSDKKASLIIWRFTKNKIKQSTSAWELSAPTRLHIISTELSNRKK